MAKQSNPKKHRSYRKPVLRVSLIIFFLFAAYYISFLSLFHVHQGMRTLVGTDSEDIKILMYSTGSSESQSIKHKLFMPLIMIYESNEFEVLEDSQDLDTEPGPRLLFYHIMLLQQFFD